MSITKKIRFEVFKRDDFKCGYCGKSPPAVKLEADHIEPISKGGTDDINNLITACFDCNRGKSNVPLDSIPPKVRENLASIKEREIQLIEYKKFLKKAELRIKKDINRVNDEYTELKPGYEFSEKFQKISLRRFLQLLPLEEVLDSLLIAFGRFGGDDTDESGEQLVKYFCGICWKKIRGENEVS